MRLRRGAWGSIVGITLLMFAVGCTSKGKRTASSAPIQAPDGDATPVKDRVIFDELTARRNGLLRNRDDELWMPTTADIQSLEEQLPGYLRREAARWPDPEPPFDPPPAPLWERAPSYHRQYIGIVRAHRRLIEGNFFCEDLGKDLRRELVDVVGGGDCFFHVTYDAKERRLVDLDINAPK